MKEMKTEQKIRILLKELVKVCLDAETCIDELIDIMDELEVDEELAPLLRELLQQIEKRKILREINQQLQDALYRSNKKSTGN